MLYIVHVKIQHIIKNVLYQNMHKSLELINLLIRTFIVLNVLFFFRISLKVSCNQHNENSRVIWRCIIFSQYANEASVWVSPACIGKERREALTPSSSTCEHTQVYADSLTQYNFHWFSRHLCRCSRPIVRPRPPAAPLPAPPHPSRPIRNHHYTWKCHDCPLIKVSVPMQLRGKVPLKQHFGPFLLISPDFYTESPQQQFTATGHSHRLNY